MADIDGVTNSDTEVIVEICLTKWTNALHSQIVKAVECTFEHKIQAIYFNFNNGLKFDMFNVV